MAGPHNNRNLKAGTLDPYWTLKRQAEEAYLDRRPVAETHLASHGQAGHHYQGEW